MQRLFKPVTQLATSSHLPRFVSSKASQCQTLSTLKTINSLIDSGYKLGGIAGLGVGSYLANDIYDTTDKAIVMGASMGLGAAAGGLGLGWIAMSLYYPRATLVSTGVAAAVGAGAIAWKKA